VDQIVHSKLEELAVMLVVFMVLVVQFWV